MHYRAEWAVTKPGNPDKGVPPQFGYLYVEVKNGPYVTGSDGSLRRKNPKSGLSKKDRRAARRDARG